MASKESNLPALYTELSKLGQNGEYERALKTANRSKLSRITRLYRSEGGNGQMGETRRVTVSLARTMYSLNVTI